MHMYQYVNMDIYTNIYVSIHIYTAYRVVGASLLRQ